MSAKSLYIASTEPNAGSLVVSIGIMELLKSRVEKIAFFRPIIENSSLLDSDSDFMIRHFHLHQTTEQCCGFTLAEVEAFLADDHENEMIEQLIEKFTHLEEEYDFILIEGLNHALLDQGLNYNLNVRLAKNFQAPFISVMNGKNKTFEQISHAILIEDGAIQHANGEHLAVFVNRLDPHIHERLQKEFSCNNLLTFFLSEIPQLDMPNVGEIKESFQCTQVLGEEKDLDRIVQRSKIAAMNIEHLLDRLEDGDLIVVPGDRPEIVLTVLSTNYAKNFPTISGVLLTGGYIPSPKFLDLLRGLHFTNIPLLAVSNDTYETMEHISKIRATIHPQHKRKIALALGAFMQAVNSEELFKKIITKHVSATTPQMFEYSLYERSRKNPKRIVLPESEDERILRAAEIILRRNAAHIILLGESDAILHHAAKLGIDLSAATIIDPNTSPLMDHYVDTFYEMRKAKGLSLGAARDALSLPSYFATMMVHCNDADGMVSGAIHTTQDTIRPALQIIKTTPDIFLVSSLFFMCMDNQVLVYADCAINQDPTAFELAQIAIASAKTAQNFGLDPRIAMLSYSTGTSGKGDDVEKVRIATEHIRTLRPDLAVEGPIQYDAAIDPDVAHIKLPSSNVAGVANVFIFPDLNTGNNTYKAVQRSSGAIAIGPVLQGLRKPVNDLSRGCEIPDIVNTILITAIQAQEAES